MVNFYYCLDCLDIVKEQTCKTCNSQNIKPLKQGTSVNVKSTKIKGKVYRMYDDEIKLIIRNEANEKHIKGYEPEKLKKIL